MLAKANIALPLVVSWCIFFVDETLDLGTFSLFAEPPALRLQRYGGSWVREATRFRCILDHGHHGDGSRLGPAGRW